MAFTGRKKRKRRSDVNHAIYMITAPDGSQYIGLTFIRQPTAKKHTRSKMPLLSVKSRFKSHCYRANNGSLDLFHESIRRFGHESFHVKILEIVRGKDSAHQRERQLINDFKPTLNTQK